MKKFLDFQKFFSWKIFDFRYPLMVHQPPSMSDSDDSPPINPLPDFTLRTDGKSWPVDFSNLEDLTQEEKVAFLQELDALDPKVDLKASLPEIVKMMARVARERGIENAKDLGTTCGNSVFGPSGNEAVS